MKISKKLKILIWFISAILVLLIGFVGYSYYTHQNVMAKYQDKYEKRIYKIENSFTDHPNIEDAGRLIDIYHSEGQYEKALFYGKECIRLGVNDTPIGYLINFQLAEIYNEFGEINLARGHLTMALVLDKKKIIFENNWINKSSLSDLLSKEEIKSLIKG